MQYNMKTMFLKTLNVNPFCKTTFQSTFNTSKLLFDNNKEVRIITKAL